MELTIEQEIQEQIIALAVNELKRLEAINDTWHGAYTSMTFADGDIIDRKMSGFTRTLKPIPRDFPRGHWIVYLHPSIQRFGKAVIMAFKKDGLALVYFGSVNENSSH